MVSVSTQLGSRRRTGQNVFARMRWSIARLMVDTIAAHRNVQRSMARKIHKGQEPRKNPTAAPASICRSCTCSHKGIRASRLKIAAEKATPKGGDTATMICGRRHKRQKLADTIK